MRSSCSSSAERSPGTAAGARRPFSGPVRRITASSVGHVPLGTWPPCVLVLLGFRRPCTNELTDGTTSMTELLEIRRVAKTFGTDEKATHALREVTFSIEEGEFVCVVGPSGCGKTTLLRCVAGLLRPSAGEVLLRGSRVAGPPESMALVFQEYSRSLMPWMSVRNNVLLPLRHKKLAKRERTS